MLVSKVGAFLPGHLPSVMLQQKAKQGPDAQASAPMHGTYSGKLPTQQLLWQHCMCQMQHACQPMHLQVQVFDG